MLSAQAYSFRQKARLAISLSWIGGYVNTIAFVTCGHMVSHVTGSLTTAMHGVMESAPRTALFFATLAGLFFAGAATSSAITEVRLRRGGTSRFVLPILVEALALAFLAIAANWYEHSLPLDVTGVYVVGGLASFALGVQNATITRISNSVVRTTHLTGIVTDLGIEGVQFVFWAGDRLFGRGAERRTRVLRVSMRDPRFERLLLLGSILGSFLLGAAIATLVHLHWPHVAVLPPVVFLLAIVFFHRTHPIVDLTAVDLVSDREFAALGVERAALPHGVLLFRPADAPHAGAERNADFETWAGTLPRDCRVAIVAVDDRLSLGGNAALVLAAASERVARHGARLLVSGVSAAQFRALHAAGALDRIGRENLHPDLEFAVSHAIHCVEQGG